MELWDTLRSAVSDGSITITNMDPEHQRALSLNFPKMGQILSKTGWQSSGHFSGSRRRNLGSKCSQAKSYMKINLLQHSGKKVSRSFLQRKRMKQVDRIYSKWVDL
eukprot:766862-Hanusia_phi.AAC.6